MARVTRSPISAPFTPNATGTGGLSFAEAQRRLRELGPNEIHREQAASPFMLVGFSCKHSGCRQEAPCCVSGPQEILFGRTRLLTAAVSVV